MARSLVDAAETGGAAPRWSAANSETGVMVGDPAAAIIAGIHAFGATAFPAARALAALARAADRPGTRAQGIENRPGLAAYLARGYIPLFAPDVWGPAATTLEYATADFSIAALAGALGDGAHPRPLHEAGAELAAALRSARGPRTPEARQRRVRPRLRDRPGKARRSDRRLGARPRPARVRRGERLAVHLDDPVQPRRPVSRDGRARAGDRPARRVLRGAERRYAAAALLHGQRAAVRRALGLHLRGRAGEDAGGGAPDPHHALRRRTGGAARQRRSRRDVGLVRLGGARPLPGDPRRRRAGAGRAAVPVGDGDGGRRPPARDHRPGGLGGGAHRAGGDPERTASPVDLAADERDPGGRKAGLRRRPPRLDARGPRRRLGHTTRRTRPRRSTRARRRGSRSSMARAFWRSAPGRA